MYSFCPSSEYTTVPLPCAPSHHSNTGQSRGVKPNRSCWLAVIAIGPLDGPALLGTQAHTLVQTQARILPWLHTPLPSLTNNHLCRTRILNPGFQLCSRYSRYIMDCFLGQLAPDTADTACMYLTPLQIQWIRIYISSIRTKTCVCMCILPFYITTHTRR